MYVCMFPFTVHARACMNGIYIVPTYKQCTAAARTSWIGMTGLIITCLFALLLLLLLLCSVFLKLSNSSSSQIGIR